MLIVPVRHHSPAAALQVEGVEYLDGLRLAEPETQEDGSETWVEKTAVTLLPYEVVELTEITVVRGEPLEPGETLAPPPPDSGQAQLPVPIPTLKDEC